jgi:hypothetical protein
VKSVVKLQRGRALSTAESFLTTDYTDKHGWKASTGQRFGERGIFPIRGIRAIRGKASTGPRPFEGEINAGLSRRSFSEGGPGFTTVGAEYL